MNIDERIDALTQSVELLKSFHEDNEKHMAEFRLTIAERDARLEALVTKIAEGTVRLLRSSETHEQRIANHEGRIRNLEL